MFFSGNARFPQRDRPRVHGATRHLVAPGVKYMVRNLSADIAHSWISAQIQDHVWVVPAFQSVHILAISALIFASFSANLAILRGQDEVRATPWLAASYRWTWTALAVLLVS